MATAIMVGIRVLSMKGTTRNTYLTATAPHDHIIMGGELLLMAVVIFLSIKYKKYYAILLSMIGTIPVLAMDLSGYAVEGAPHLRVDFLAAVMILIVGFVGILICIYAVGYMKDYHNHHT